MQSFLIYITGPASLKVVQKARNRGSECCRLCFYSGLHQGGFFWGRKWRPFFSVFRRECVWVWWCLPAATKICWWAVLCVSCKRKALTQLPCLFSSRYSIYCCMTWTWLSAEAEKRNSFRGETQTHVVLKEKKKKKDIWRVGFGRTIFHFIPTELEPPEFHYVPTQTQKHPCPRHHAWAVGVRHLNSVSLRLSSHLNTHLQLAWVFEYVSKDDLAPCWILPTQKKI